MFDDSELDLIATWCEQYHVRFKDALVSFEIEIKRGNTTLGRLMETLERQVLMKKPKVEPLSVTDWTTEDDGSDENLYADCEA